MTKPPSTYIERRTTTCQALMEAAEPNMIAKFLVGQEIGVPLVGGLVAGKVFEWSKALTGGTWIGGSAYLTEDAVSFFPDMLNKLGFKNLETIHVPLTDVRRARFTMKNLQPAVAVETESATLWLSLYWKPKGFAEAINTAASAAKDRTAANAAKDRTSASAAKDVAAAETRQDATVS